MQTRDFGRTGLKTSILGYGGFHLLEITVHDVDYLLNRYLDAGGNYIETAAGYGDGESEMKIGNDFVCAFRLKEEAVKFYNTLGKRLGKFGLELAEEKTKIIRF